MQHHSLWAKCASNTFRKLRKHRKRFFLLWSLIRRPKKNTFTGSKTTQNWLFSSHLYIFQTTIDRGLGTGRFPVLIGPTSPITPQTMLDACIQNSFRVSICTGWGGRDNCKKISKRMHCFMKEHRMTEKYEYCITVPRSFVHDCSVSRRRVIFLVLSF